MKHRFTALIAVTCIAITSSFWSPSSAVRASSPIPAGLPTHFGVGLSGGNDQNGILGVDGWLPQSGIPWDYSYLYISWGWENWGARNGTYPIKFATDAASHNYIPVFTYYTLLGIDSSCGSCPAAQQYLTHLNSTKDMANYWSDFRTFMQRLSAKTYNGVSGLRQNGDRPSQRRSQRRCRKRRDEQLQMLRVLHRSGKRSLTPQGVGGKLR